MALKCNVQEREKLHEIRIGALGKSQDGTVSWFDFSTTDQDGSEILGSADMPPDFNAPPPRRNVTEMWFIRYGVRTIEVTGNPALVIVAMRPPDSRTWIGESAIHAR